MRQSRFTVEQITLALRQAEAGMSVGEIYRKLQVTDTTCYRWKKKYEGLRVSELRESKKMAWKDQIGYAWPSREGGLLRRDLIWEMSIKICRFREFQLQARGLG